MGIIAALFLNNHNCETHGTFAFLIRTLNTDENYCSVFHFLRGILKTNITTFFKIIFIEIVKCKTKLDLIPAREVYGKNI